MSCYGHSFKSILQKYSKGLALILIHLFLVVVDGIIGIKKYIGMNLPCDLDYTTFSNRDCMFA